MTRGPALALRPVSWLTLWVFLGGCTASKPISLQQVEAMRMQAQVQGSVVEVYPLKAPEAAVHLENIRQLEVTGRPRQALARARESAEQLPRDPLVWQYVAELALQTGDFSQSLIAAAKAASLGPPRGALCVRSWQTQEIAQQTLGDDDAAREAAEQARGCTLIPQPRL